MPNEADPAGRRRLRRLPAGAAVSLYERGRSLGLGVMVSAQWWQGLGRDADERYRIAATADGGVWLLQTAYPDPLVELAGTQPVLESARKLIAAGWGDEGTTRIQRAFTADPDLIRALDVGQACYIRHRPAVYVHVTMARPLSLPSARRPGAPGTVPAAGSEAGPVAQPLPAVVQAPGRLDDVLGPAPCGPGVPVDALGLPSGRQLADEQVHQAWRETAAATDPDRPDSGTAAGVAVLAVSVCGGTPSAPAIVSECGLWWALAIRGDLAPPPGR